MLAGHPNGCEVNSAAATLYLEINVLKPRPTSSSSCILSALSSIAFSECQRVCACMCVCMCYVCMRDMDVPFMTEPLSLILSTLASYEALPL